jgi:hypothetical protein
MKGRSLQLPVDSLQTIKELNKTKNAHCKLKTAN